MTETESFDRIANVFSAIDLKTVAILLDVDGTIVDLGPAPADVHVSDGLRATLQQISEFADGAVALVSGRPIADLDRLFTPLRLSAIGNHGAEMRVEDVTHDRGVTPLPKALRSRISQAVADGVLIEDKG